MPKDIPFNDYNVSSAESRYKKRKPIAVTPADRDKVKKRRDIEERQLMRELNVDTLFAERVKE